MMHIGDEAMFEEFVAQARSRGIHDIVAVSSNPDDTSARYGLESVPRLGLSGDRASMIAQAPDAALPALDTVDAEWDRRVALGVVMAAHGYPDNPRKGDVIHGLGAKHDDAHVFHAGTSVKDGDIVVTGGRVLCVTALGDTVKIAQKRAYEVADGIRFDGMQLRRDIGWRAIKQR